MQLIHRFRNRVEQMRLQSLGQGYLFLFSIKSAQLEQKSKQKSKMVIIYFISKIFIKFIAPSFTFEQNQEMSLLYIKVSDLFLFFYAFHYLPYKNLNQFVFHIFQKSMKLRYSGNIMPFEDSMKKVSAITWSPSGKKLAVGAADRTVYLFDENGQKKDKFPTKPSDKGQKSYLIRGLEFSPDSQKIAVGQSDNIVFVYKIGLEWGEKKAICNKFPVSASITCMVWPKDHPNELLFGLADGKVRLGVLKSNKSNVLYSADSYCISLAASRDGATTISGHVDGSVYAYSMDNQSFKKILTHHSVPYALGFGENIMAAGNDKKVTFYDTYGNVLQRFDYSHEDKVKDFTVAAFNPSGDTVALGNFNRYYVYNLNTKRGQWEENTCKQIQNYYTVTSLCWKNDGSKLVTGNLCGSVDIYDASVKKFKKGKYLLNYVSPSQVLIQIEGSAKESVLKSYNGLQITKVNFYNDRYAVGNTFETLIITDIETNRTSQIYWKGAGNQKFDFSSPNLCMISNAGELTLVQYGRNEPLGTCRTEYMKPNLISARINEKGVKMIAYLLDLQTISLFDLNTSTIVSQISHDSKIDYLELNANSNKLLFKDKRKQLYIYNLANLTKSTLLPYCTFAKWVPQSEVVVAQNRQNLNVWYSIDHPEKVTIYNIKGDVEGIERKNGKTEVLVSDSSGNAISSYSLNEALIDFGFALQAKDLEKAALILDNSELNNETEANWRALAKMALETQNVYVAEHCYGALGDVAKASYLRKIIELIEGYQKETGRKDGINYYKVQSKLAVLQRQFHRAESLLLQNNEIEQAMEMYQQLHKWDETIKCAEKKHHPDVEELKKNYYNWLIETNQEQKAAEIKQEEGDYNMAINLYLKGGIPARAANVVYNSNVSFPQDLLEKIASSLASASMHEKAGELYEEMDLLQKALDCYVKGNAYKKAVDLAKSAEPRLVTSLQERWGNYLLSIKQTQAAINHFIEAEKIQKAIEASILAREWNKAIQLLATQTPEVARPYYRQIAKHFASIRQYDFAEKYYLKAALPVDAFQMYAQVGKWQQALRLAKQNLPESEINNLYVKQAKKFEEEQKWKEAEKMYLIVEEYDLAIAMYKKCAQYDNMIRMVAKYRSNLLKETHLAVAQKLHKDGNFKTAEQHYISAGAWRAAVEMYKNQGLWEQAVRCSKLYGKDQFTCELAKRWAQSLGPEQGMKMLLKMNLVDAVVEYQSDKGEFDEAFKMANLHAKHKIRDVHLKFAFKLQDEKRYKQAEAEFIKAGKAQQAISMYENIGDFHSALTVASQYQPQARDAILINQAKSFIEGNKREYGKAEAAYITARKPQLAIKMYLEINNTQQALRVARKHAPHLVEQIMRREPATSNQSPEQKLQQAKTWDDSRNYSKAIEGYLQITTDDFKDPQLLEQIWRRAVQLAVTYEKDKAMKVVKIVCGRLCQIRAFDSAGELLQQMNLFEQAVGTYCQGGNYDAARHCAKLIKNSDLNAKLIDYIDRKQRDTNKSERNPWNALKLGDYETACEIFKETGDWKNCLDKSQEKGPELLNKYLNAYIKVTVQAGNFAAAAQAYSQYGMPLIPKNYPTYKMLTLEIFVECEQKEIEPLRKALYDFYSLLQGTTDPGNPTLIEYNNYLTIAHLSNLKFIYESKPAAQNLHQRITVALLRYCEFIRLDKLFYEAGISCQKNNIFGLASILLNRYLDISDIIDDPDNNNISEDDEFRLTDIPSPYNVNMPMKNMINEGEKQKIKDWLLEVSMNHKFDSSLPLKSCEKCSTKIYDASVVCFKCKNRSEVCILTGYPVNGSNGKQCRSCGKWGLKDAWGTYLNCFANCPWCNKLP